MIGRLAFAVGMAVVIILVFGLLLAASAHGDAQWIADGNFKGADGRSCCGPTDCHRLAPDAVTYRPGTFTVLHDGRALPFAEALTRLSPDADWWVCAVPGFVRCLWRPAIGG